MAIENAPNPSEPEEFHWIWEGRNNRPLQVFFFVNDWTDYTFQQKYDWLMFAQREGTIVSSTIVPKGHDECDWTVLKKYDQNPEMMVGSSRIIKIPGLSDFLATAVKNP